MKIRTNYVSNSSSSSFCIIYKSKDDFIKFNKFKGYYTFIEDLEKSNIVEAEAAICVHLHNYCWKTFDKFTDKDFHKSSYYLNNKYDWLDFIFEEAEVDSNEFWDIIAKINNKGFKFLEDNKENIKPDNPEYKKYCDSYYKDMETQTKIDNFSKKVCEGLKKRGYELGFIRYEDDTNEGWYMESKFMPFISLNPEKEYLIITQNEH